MVKTAVLGLLASIHEASFPNSCLTLYYYETATCTGSPANFSFEVPSVPGSPCTGINETGTPCTENCHLWLQDAYCNASGDYVQSIYTNEDGCEGEALLQVMNMESCTQNYRAACRLGPCSEDTSVMGGTYAIFHNFDGPNCTGNSTNLTLPTWAGRGSPCFDFGTYSVKDQYCDEDGIYRESVFQGIGCQGAAREEVFDRDHCVVDAQLMENTKLGICKRSSSSGSASKAALLATAATAGQNDKRVDEVFHNSLAVAGLGGTLIAIVCVLTGFYTKCAERCATAKLREPLDYQELKPELLVEA